MPSRFIASLSARLPPTRRDARLASGLVLFAYVASHLVNHALGLISIDAAERGLAIAVAFWQSVPGTVLLYGAVTTHVALAFLALYDRRTLRMPPVEIVRIALGFGMPTLLIGHAIATRLAFEVYGHPADYAHVVWSLWHSGRQGLQIALLVPGWLHGCLGLRFAFRKRPWFERARDLLFAGALLLPVLAVLGFLSMLKEVAVLAQAPSWPAQAVGTVETAQRALLGEWRDRALAVYLAAVAAVFAARAIRRFVEERRGRLITISYPGRTVRVPRRWSVLDASRSHHIGHLSLCGGRGRCSTCRVRVVDGLSHCPPPGDDEARTLARIGATPDVRLACQLKPDGDVGVVPLLAVPDRRSSGVGPARLEREAVVLLAVPRWTPSYHRLLPHDRLYALERFDETLMSTIRAEGGVPGSSIGARSLVLFGLDGAFEDAGGQALRAVERLVPQLDAVGAQLQRTIGCTVRADLYLHVGTIAVRRADDASSAVVTAVGDAVDAVRTAASSDDAAAATSRVLASHELLSAAGRPIPASSPRQVELPYGSRVAFTAIGATATSQAAARKPAVASSTADASSSLRA